MKRKYLYICTKCEHENIVEIEDNMILDSGGMGISDISANDFGFGGFMLSDNQFGSSGIPNMVRHSHLCENCGERNMIAIL